MGRIMAIDYGRKRVGIAVTDPLKIIATGLTTVHATEIIDFLRDYFKKEPVELIVVGEPKDLKNRPSEAEKDIKPFLNLLKKHFPDIQVERMDERFTSRMALDTMLAGGLKKMDRRSKETVDMISATIILQSYLEKTKK